MPQATSSTSQNLTISRLEMSNKDTRSQTKRMKRRCGEPVVNFPPKRHRLVDGVEPAEKSAPTARLCSIYLRDFLSFLAQPQVQECRTVSRALNSAILSGWFQSLLPRRHFHSLTIFTCDDTEFKLTKDGFVSGRQAGPMRKGVSWVSVLQFRHCCTELADPLAASLVGQLIFPSKAAKTPVCIRFKRWRVSDEPVTFRAPNLLTQKTAFALAHLAHHLRNTTFAEMEIEVRPKNPHLLSLESGKGGGGAKLLNPAIVRLFNISAELLKQGPHAINRMPIALDASCIETARQLGRFRCMQSLVGNSRPDDAVEKLMEWRRYCREVHFTFGVSTADFIDELIERLENLDAAQFRLLISSASFTCNHEIIGWPERCNEDTLVGKVVRGRKSYTFAFANKHSVEGRFTLMLASLKRGERVQFVKLDIVVK